MQFISQWWVLCPPIYLSLTEWFTVFSIFVWLYRSAHRQAAAHHSPRPVQSDTRGGQRGPAEVPGIRGPHPLHQLAEGWCQSFGEGLPHVPAGTGQPANQKHQGKGCGWYTVMVIITFFLSCCKPLCHSSLKIQYLSLYNLIHVWSCLDEDKTFCWHGSRVE